jgi:hypothetical protein
MAAVIAALTFVMALSGAGLILVGTVVEEWAAVTAALRCGRASPSAGPTVVRFTPRPRILRVPEWRAAA